MIHYKNNSNDRIMIRSFESGLSYVYRMGIKGYVCKMPTKHLDTYLANGGYFRIGITTREKQEKQGQLDLNLR